MFFNGGISSIVGSIFFGDGTQWVVGKVPPSQGPCALGPMGSNVRPMDRIMIKRIKLST